MPKELVLHPERLLPVSPTVRKIAQRLYREVVALPIVSPHGHTDPKWFAYNDNFSNPAELLIQPDHYIYRMLYSQGVSLESLGLQPLFSGLTSHERKTLKVEQDPRKIWATFADHYHLFLGTPSRLWLDYVFKEIFGLVYCLSKDTADIYYETIDDALKQDHFKPRALFDTFNIEVLATTESALDDLSHHRQIQEASWQGRVITTFRPDAVIDPEYEHFTRDIKNLGRISGEDVTTFKGYLAALRNRRDFFKANGATSTDHGHPTVATADLSAEDKERLYKRAVKGETSAHEAELFRAQMLTEMAAMSIEDGLVMQIHPGSYRNHNPYLFTRFGRDKGADIPMQTEYVRNLQPLLTKFGNEPNLSIIVFTLDETTYSRELAPLAGHYPCLKLGPAWWFHDSPEGMRRFRQQTTETAGLYNTVGFNDDTRALLSIPARHDVARRMDCGFLAELVADHRIDEDEARDLAIELTYSLAKNAYKL